MVGDKLDNDEGSWASLLVGDSGRVSFSEEGGVLFPCL